MRMIKMNLSTNDEVIVNLRWFIIKTGEDFQYVNGKFLKNVFEEVTDKGKQQQIYYSTYRTIFEDRIYGVISDQPLVGDDLKNILETCDHRCSTCEEYNHCEFRISNEERERLIKLANESIIK